MVKIVVAGGGWSGCAAALAAVRAGAAVTLLERTDMLLGTGLVGGIFRNNGRFTAAEEAIAMGGGDFFLTMDAHARHRNIEFPGHRHASLYDVTKIEPAILHLLRQAGVEVRKRVRAVDVVKYGKTVRALLLEDGSSLAGDAFVDTTGTAGPMGNCLLYGYGCAMCVLRCPAFGPRVSIAARCGVKELMGRKADGTPGAMSGSCKLNKGTLSPALQEQLAQSGVAVIAVPEELRKTGALGRKACCQYAIPEYAENIVLLDTGHAKLMTSCFPLEELRTLPGLATARYEDPYAGGKGNSVRYLAIAPCDDTLKVSGVDNLFCGGEKAGILVGHTEAIVTGLLAGHNAVRHCLDMPYLTLPRTLATGDFIAYIHEQMRMPDGMKLRYTFSGSVYFERMKVTSLYTTSLAAISERVAQAGLTAVYAQGLL